MTRTLFGGSGTVYGQVLQDKLLKIQKSGQFLDHVAQAELLKMKKNGYLLYKGDNVRRVMIIVIVISPDFVRDSLIY